MIQWCVHNVHPDYVYDDTRNQLFPIGSHPNKEDKMHQRLIKYKSTIQIYRAVIEEVI